MKKTIVIVTRLATSAQSQAGLEFRSRWTPSMAAATMASAVSVHTDQVNRV